MPRRAKQHEWRDARAYREAVLTECRKHFEKLFGQPCSDDWLRGWRRSVRLLVDQDARARKARRSGSLKTALAFLRSEGLSPGAPAKRVVSPQTFALQCDVDAAQRGGARLLPQVGEVPRDVHKLSHGGLEAMLLFFENHRDSDGASRWLSDRELAVLSLLLFPARISVRDDAGDQNPEHEGDALRLPPRVAIEREERLIRRARRTCGELRRASQKRAAVGAVRDRRPPLLKAPPGWADGPSAI